VRGILDPSTPSEFAIALEQVATNKAHVLRSFNEGVYHFADVLTTGVVAENKCGKTSVRPVPRQIVLFASPSHWWEKVM
jgi:hypothetical protein